MSNSPETKYPKGCERNVNYARVAQFGKSSCFISNNTIPIIENMENDTILKGALTELKCKLYFMELGYIVSTPEPSTRYDFILDTGEKLLKIQVKTSKIVGEDEECLSFKTCSSHITREGFVRKDYKADGIDYFCTWFQGECYLIPVQDCGSAEKKLRLKPTKNGQVKGISFAKDYVAKEVLNR